MDGDTGVLADMKELGVWEPISVKEQTFKTAIEVMSMGTRLELCQYDGVFADCSVAVAY